MFSVERMLCLSATLAAVENTRTDGTLEAGVCRYLNMTSVSMGYLYVDYPSNDFANAERFVVFGQIIIKKDILKSLNTLLLLFDINRYKALPINDIL